MHLTKLILRAGPIAAMLLASTSTSAVSFSPCDLLSGLARTICQRAQDAADRSTAKSTNSRASSQGSSAAADGLAAPDPQAPAGTAAAQGLAKPDLSTSASSQRSATPASTARPVAPPQAVQVAQPDNGMYRSDKFSGLITWRDIFDKAANKPQEFETFMTAVKGNATGSAGKISGLMTGPSRNNYEKILTDYSLYKLYEKKDAALLAKQNECLLPRDYTPEEACDCLAGFPGQTLIGPGAGELVTSSNHTAATKACGIASANAKSNVAKARYKGQQARAQVYAFDTSQAAAWADEATSMGYKMGALIKAMCVVRDLEVLGSGFPPITELTYKEEVQRGVDYLKAAKSKKIPETYIFATQLKQTTDHFAFNNAVLGPITKELMREPTQQERDSNAAANMQQVQMQRETGY